MHANLTGTIAAMSKNDGGVVVDVEFPSTGTTIRIPVLAEKAKVLGLGTEVELLLKKKRKPRTKKEVVVETVAAPVVAAATNGTHAPAPRGRKRAAAATTA